MSNPLFKEFGGRNQTAGPAGQFNRMMSDFQKFRAGFQGDPKAEVQKLLQSGQMSQQQLDQLQSMAKQFMQFLK